MSDIKNIDIRKGMVFIGERWRVCFNAWTAI